MISLTFLLCFQNIFFIAWRITYRKSSFSRWVKSAITYSNEGSERRVRYLGHAEAAVVFMVSNKTGYVAPITHMKRQLRWGSESIMNYIRCHKCGGFKNMCKTAEYDFRMAWRQSSGVGARSSGAGTDMISEFDDCELDVGWISE